MLNLKAVMHSMYGKKRVIVAAVGFAVSSPSQAICVATGASTYNCDGVSVNNVPLTGTVTLDNAAGNVTLTNEANVNINNDRSADIGGTMNTLLTNGSGNFELTNKGTIRGGRDAVYDLDGNEVTPAFAFDSTLFTSPSGQLLYDGAAAGLATTIHLGIDTASVKINNLIGPVPALNSPPDFYGQLIGGGDFSSVIFGNSANIEINNFAGVVNNSFSGAMGDTFTEGHWAIANYGAGNTILNMNSGQGSIYGDVLFVDRNPLLEAAQRLNPSLVLEYDANNVGIRNSVINLGGNSPSNFGSIQGNIYLGAGEHVINTTITGSINGNIYVDQKDAQITDATGNVISTIAGAKKFTLNSNGTFNNALIVNDVVGSVNTLNFNLGGFNGEIGSSGGTPTNVVFNGLGLNTLNAHCNQRFDNAFATCSMGNASGLTSINITGARFYSIDPAAIVQANQDINIDSSIYIFNHLLSAPNVTIGAGTTVSGAFFPDDNVDYANLPFPVAPDEIGAITGNVVNHGKIDVRNATMTINGDVTFDANSNLSLRIRDIGNGRLNIVGGVGSFIGNASITPTTKDVFIRNGQTFTIANNTTGTPTVNNASGVVQFKSDDSTGDLRLIATVAIPNSVNASAGANNAVNAIMDYSGNNTAFNALAAQIQSLDALELKRAAERLRPENHDGAMRLVLSNVDQIFGVVESHLFENQVDGAGKALIESPDGKVYNGAGIWAQGFGGGGTQNSRQNTDGYALKSSGFAIGADRLLGANKDLRLGVLAAYSRANVDNLGFTDNNRVDVNTYTAGLYGAKSYGDWYLNGASAVSLNRYNSKRVALEQVADGAHDGWQYSAKVDAGWPIQLTDSFTLTPIASLSYNHISESGYTESGTLPMPTTADSKANSLQIIPSIDSATRLKVESRAFDSIRSGLGAKTLFNVQEKDWNAGIEFRALLNHEFGNLAQDATARFVSGGARFYSPGAKLARDTILLGSSVRLTGDDDNDQISLLASYDAEFREKYFGQSLSMMLRYDFDQAPAYIERANMRKVVLNAKSVPTQLVAATEQDIAEITQAMQASTQSVAESLSPENQQKLAISSVLNYWINALTSKNVENYFNVYASDFVTSDGSTRQQWERKRKSEILKSNRPTISIVNLSIRSGSNEASAYFTMTMQDGESQQAVLKSVDFVKKGGSWLIASEDSMAMAE